MEKSCIRKRKEKKMHFDKNVMEKNEKIFYV